MARALNDAEGHHVVDVLDGLLTSLGIESWDLFVLDYGRRHLTSLRAAEDPIPMTSDDARVTAASTTVPTIDDGSIPARILVPILHRAEVLGCLDVSLDGTPTTSLVDQLSSTAILIGAQVVAGGNTDLFERLKRRYPLTLGAEMQWDALPPLAFIGDGFALAGALEPAYDIAGDVFDYATTADTVQMVSFDAMGHGTQAALAAHVALAAMRNARIDGEAAPAIAKEVNSALFDVFGGARFVTGLVLDINRSDGVVTAVNAGHPHARRITADGVETVELLADPPLGIRLDHPARPQTFRLEPGDRLVLVSDGVLDAAPDDGGPYGERRLNQHLSEVGGRPLTDLVRTVGASVLAHRSAPLVDDVTAIALDWLPHEASGAAL